MTHSFVPESAVEYIDEVPKATNPHFPKLSLWWMATKMTVTMVLRQPWRPLQKSDAAPESLTTGL
jgi:hypothetical protein